MGGWKPKAAPMSVNEPIAALTVLLGLSFLARERNYLLTATNLLVLSGTLATWFVALYWKFG
jgi:hypothetical protein